ncbi:hypothetical protein [Salinifilum ghardaiensis]
MSARTTDRSDHSAEIRLVARALAEEQGRFAEPVTDVRHWLATHEHRGSGALLVVWDRTDAAIVEYAREDVEVCVAASRLDWARRWFRDNARRKNIPGQQSRSTG